MSSTSKSFRFLLNLLKSAQTVGTIALLAVTVWESPAAAQSSSKLRSVEPIATDNAIALNSAVIAVPRHEAAGIQQMAGRAVKQASGLSRSASVSAAEPSERPQLMARVATEGALPAPVRNVPAAMPTDRPKSLPTPVQAVVHPVAAKQVADARLSLAPLRTPMPPVQGTAKLAYTPPSPILNDRAPLATTLPIAAPASAYPTNPLYMPPAPMYAQVPMAAMNPYSAQPGYGVNYAQAAYPQPGYAPMPIAQPMPIAPPMAYPQPAYAQAAYPQAAYPQPAYGAAYPTYGAPAPSYGAAYPAYAAPAPTYAAPAYGYGAPAPAYGYGAPAPMMPYPMVAPPMPPMPSPYAVLQSPYASAQLTPPVSRLRSAAPVMPYAAPQYPAAPQYVQQQYAPPQYAPPQYAQPQYVQQPVPQYQQPAPMPQYQQPAPMPQLGADPQAVIGNPLNAPLTVPVSPSGVIGTRTDAAALKTAQAPLIRSTATNKPSLTLQGVYQYQAGESSARARISGMYPLSSRALFGTTLDVSSGQGFSDTPNDGFNVNELFFATSLAEVPNLRFTVGQLDLTSYFDRNSFAKDGASHFFNPTFQTNPALAAAGLGSRPGLLVNWSLSDNIEAKAATFSAARGLGDFSLNGFAGEVGLRYGNAILRGTYVTGRDSGNKDSFRDVFSIRRPNNQFGLLRDDRESGFGVNGEVFIPKMKMGLFARYGRYNNLDVSEGADTYGAGLSFLDVFSRDDRLGLAYGSALTNERLRRQAGRPKEDALELFYDFRFLPNLRMGLSLQQRNDFSEVVAGVRVKTEFDITPKGRQLQ